MNRVLDRMILLLQNPDSSGLIPDAAKMNRVLDRMNLDFVKAESGSMVTEAVEKENAPEKAENVRFR